jgi:hypothetical protein
MTYYNKSDLNHTNIWGEIFHLLFLDNSLLKLNETAENKTLDNTGTIESIN